jgi:gamma-glutamyltranspeptidase/glutathione hydrolase
MEVYVLCKIIFAVIVLTTAVLSPTREAAAAGRIPIHAQTGMVVSASEIASRVGRDVLQRGGNAIDAAVATGFALAVTWPSAGNIGGGFLVYHGSDGRTTSFDFREKAPQSATRDMYLDKNGADKATGNHEGFLSVGVPGTVAGLYLAHKQLGKLPWKDLVEPAARLAREGFPFTWALHNQTTAGSLYETLDRYPSTDAVMRKPGGIPYAAGETFRQPDLARTLERIRDRGHDGFYSGKTAKQLAAFMSANGGAITEADLASYRAIERKPIHGTYRGYDIYAMPPPSSGGVAVVEMLNILEEYDLEGMGHNSAQYLHVLTEAMRRAFADRAEHLGDPDFNPDMPVSALISKTRAAELRRSIDLTRASVSGSVDFNLPFEGTETTHYSVVDSDRNAVSVTYTLEQSYGSKIVAAGLGFFLNNEMGDFNPIPGRTSSRGMIGTPPNWIQPG